MTTTAKGIPKLSTSAFIKDGPTDINAALDATDALIDQRGKSIIATPQTRSNTSYGLLSTPDRVQSVVVPTDGLVEIGYQALAKVDTGTARAAVFLGSNQITIGMGDGAPVTQAAVIYGGSSIYRRVHTGTPGLLSTDTATDATDVTTGQIIGSYSPAWSVELGGTIHNSSNGSIGIPVGGSVSVPSVVGGPVYVFLAAGTYDISIQWKTDSGSTVTAKDRRLWVRALSF